MDRTIHKIFPGNETIILSQFPIFPGVESIILKQFPLKIAIKFQAPLIPSPVRGHSKTQTQTDPKTQRSTGSWYWGIDPEDGDPKLRTYAHLGYLTARIPITPPEGIEVRDFI